MKLKNIKFIWDGFIGKSIWPHQLSWILELPGRNILYSGKRLIKHFQIKKTDAVLEIAVGSGHYAGQVARHVAEFGKLYMLDIQPEMIRKAKKRLFSDPQVKNQENLKFIIGPANNIPLPADSVDKVYIICSFNQLAKREEVLREIYRVLKPAGQLSITETHPDPYFFSRTQVRSYVNKEGLFQEIRSFGCGPNHTTIFNKVKRKELNFAKMASTIESAS